MTKKTRNKALVFNCCSYEEVLFDVGSEEISTQFNGNGGFNYFHLIDNPKFNVSGTSLLTVFVDGKAIDVTDKKQVICVGRTQKIIYKLTYGKVAINQFVYKEAIYNKITFKFDKEVELGLTYSFLRYVDMPKLASNAHYEWSEGNVEYYVTKKAKTGSINVCVSFVSDPKKNVGKTNKFFREVKNEFESLPIPEGCNNELYKAIYTSSMFAALENYKVKNEFRAFAAGVNYLSPLRTYFRDSYWTTLCLYNYKPELIKDQIIVLARGISDKFDCPSAVKSDFSGFWGGHVDSPCFFVMMVADYVKNTKDASLLNLKVNNFTIRELAVNVMNRLMERSDKTHLINKQGPYNKLDWCDAVNRNGYVTYDECLYYQALRCTYFILLGKDGKYLKEAEVVKNAINKLLWDEKKGYYLNFVDGDFKQDSLSIDTMFTVLFDIVPENKKEILLDNFEKILYSKNHKELKDFGVMCLYPTYKGRETTHSVSSKPFNYHNGANWPYLAGIFAYMLRVNGRDYDYALTSWFKFSIKNNCYTPLEFLTPYYHQGSNLQAWSSTSAFALQTFTKNFFQYNIKEGDFIYEKD